MKTKIEINGNVHDAMKFKTLKAANNFIAKSEGRIMLFYRAHEYYTSI